MNRLERYFRVKEDYFMDRILDATDFIQDYSHPLTHSIVQQTDPEPFSVGYKKLNILFQYHISTTTPFIWMASDQWGGPTGYWLAVILWNRETTATKRVLFINSYSYSWSASQSLIDFELNWHTHRTTFRIPPTYDYYSSGIIILSVFRDDSFTKIVSLEDLGPGPANKWAQTRVSCPLLTHIVD